MEKLLFYISTHCLILPSTKKSQTDSDEINLAESPEQGLFDGQYRGTESTRQATA